MSSRPSEPRPSWPLLLLAAMSFIPGAGFVCGSLAVSWGLLSKRPRAKLAIGIGATGAFLQVAVFIALVSSKGTGGLMFREGFNTFARDDLRTVVTALEAYHAKQSEYPATLEELARGRAVNIFDVSGGFTLRFVPYQYHRAADGQSYDLFGVGPDHRSGTADDVRPLLPDSVRVRSGYRPEN